MLRPLELSRFASCETGLRVPRWLTIALSFSVRSRVSHIFSEYSTSLFPGILFGSIRPYVRVEEPDAGRDHPGQVESLLLRRVLRPVDETRAAPPRAPVLNVEEYYPAPLTFVVTVRPRSARSRADQRRPALHMPIVINVPRWRFGKFALMI